MTAAKHVKPRSHPVDADEASALADQLALADYRRLVAQEYVDVRHRAHDAGWAAAWADWVASRTRRYRNHPMSPLRADARLTESLPHFDYDPSWHLVGRVHTAPRDRFEVAHSGSGTTTFERIGTVEITRESVESHLELFWLDGYGGGLFLPFTDMTSGQSTYGGGRYLLDGAKSADLGGVGDTLILDFNFAYHPSCVHDPRWSCPLAPPGNRIVAAVRAGERLA